MGLDSPLGRIFLKCFQFFFILNICHLLDSLGKHLKAIRGGRNPSEKQSQSTESWFLSSRAGILTRGLEFQVCTHSLEELWVQFESGPVSVEVGEEGRLVGVVGVFTFRSPSSEEFY